MKSPNLREIRDKLPHGSIKLIAEKLGLPIMTVSNFFNKGWYPQHTNRILNEAVAIIQDSYPDEDLMENINELGLTGGSSVFSKPRKIKRASAPDNDFPFWILLIAAVVAILAFFPGVLAGIIAKFRGPQTDKGVSADIY